MTTPKRHTNLIDEASFAKAGEQGRRLLARGPLATAARYESRGSGLARAGGQVLK